MYTVEDVRIALRKHEKRQAVEMMKTVLSRNPTADAWFLAAKMTRDQDKAIVYLNRAIMLNPRHKDSLAMLKSLGVTPKTSSRMIIDEFFGFIHDQSNKSILLRHLKPGQQVAAFMIVVAIIIGSFGFAFSNAIAAAQQPEVVIPQVAPAAASIVTLHEDTVIDHFATSSLPISTPQRELNDHEMFGTTIRFTLTDRAGQQHQITVLVYRNIASLVDDQANLKAYETFSTVVGKSNAMLIIPQAVPADLAQQLINTFKVTPGI